MARKILWELDDYGREYVFLGPKPTKIICQYTLVGDRVEETREITVHTFSMGDVEDPDLYAAEPLLKWQESDEGKWVMENAVETPCWHRMADPMNYGYKYAITAKLQGARLTEWLLRHGK